MVFVINFFVKLETASKISKEIQFWKSKTWEHWEVDREKNVIFHKQKEMGLLKIGQYNFYSQLSIFSLVKGKYIYIYIYKFTKFIITRCPLPKSFQINASFIKSTLSVTSLDINKNVTLAHVKQHLKIVSGIIKRRSTT